MKIRNAVAVSLLSAPDSWKIFAKRFMFLPLFLFILCPSAFAQNLDDFRSAAGSKGGGVKLIPYPTMQTDAENLSREVNKWKVEVQSQSYDNFEKEKDNLLNEIKKNKEEIEKTKKEIAEFKSKHPDGTVKPFEDEIGKKESVISGFNSKLNDVNVRTKAAADSFGNLNTARANLRKKFDEVITELSNSKSNPTRHLGATFSDDDKKKFENYISVIESEIKSGIADHKVQEEGAQRTKERLEQLIQKKEI